MTANMKRPHLYKLTDAEPTNFSVGESYTKSQRMTVWWTTCFSFGCMVLAVTLVFGLLVFLISIAVGEGSMQVPTAAYNAATYLRSQPNPPQR